MRKNNINKKKFLKKLVVFLVLGCCLVSNIKCESLRSYASDEEYKTFLQNDSRWSDTHLGGSTIGSVGCLVTSVSILMAYANPDLRDVSIWNPEVLAGYLTFDKEGNMTWGGISNADSTFTQIADTDYGATISEEDVKNYLFEGNYVLVHGSNVYKDGHWAPVVGWDDDNNKPILFDVAGGMYDWDYWKSHGLGRMVVYKSSLNSSVDTILNNKGNSYTQFNDLSEEEQQKILGLRSELELSGMSAPPVYVENAQQIELVDDSYLSQEERDTLNLTKENLNAGKRDILWWFSVISKAIGIFLLIYSTLLLMAMIFDKINNWVDISMVKVFSLGKYELSKDEDLQGLTEKDKKGTLVAKQLAFRIVILFIAGIICTSGIMVWLYTKLTNIF